VVLPDEPDQARGKLVWHLNGIHDRAHGGVMGCQIFNLSRQIFFDRPFDAFIQEFCGCRAIEETVEVARVVRHINVAIWKSAPVDCTHQRPGVCL
jgi:hypothetical protein